MNSRNIQIDVLKGFAIFIVVWGHCIQFLADAKYDFFSNEIFKIIYTFHMPLFMVISGYLFYPALQKKSFVDIAGGKISQLITPVFFWFAIASLIFNNKITIDSVTHTIVYGLWFIWTLYAVSYTHLTLPTT